MSLIIFSVIILSTILYAVYSREKSEQLSVEQYLVGGRKFNAILLFFLAVGEIYGVGTILGFPGGVYAKGPSYGIWFLGYILLAYAVGYFFAPLIWRAGKQYGAMTIADIFKGHYSHRGLELTVTITALIFLIPWAQLQFEGLVVSLNALGFHLSAPVATIIAGVMAYIYISVSGVKAPAIISIVKDILMFLAIVIVGGAVLHKVGSVSHLFEMAKQQGALVKVDKPMDMNFAISTIIFQAFAFYAVPHVTGVFFTGRSERAVKKAQIVMPLYMFMFPFLIIISYFALATIPNLDKPNSAFMATAISLLPPWLIGVIAAGAVLSGIVVLSMISLVIGALVSRNLIKNISEQAQLKSIKGVVILYLLLSMAITIFAPSLMISLVNTAYYGFGQILPGFIGVFFIRKLTPIGIAAGILAGDVAVLGMSIGKISIYNINIGLIALLLNVIVAYAVSVLFKSNPIFVAPITKQKNSSQPSISSQKHVGS
ncbi:sodium:solute symporter family protein [Bacillus sp. S14(2024)]|uniref:sodium:solute symporter family protein n=1 Tax=Bacillus sp. S14(2024) TaxID=3162884 RepID=UPI003D1908A5